MLTPVHRRYWSTVDILASIMASDQHLESTVLDQALQLRVEPVPISNVYEKWWE